MAKIVTNIINAETRGTINVYAVRYSKRGIKDNKSIALPSNMNSELKKEFCKNVVNFQDKQEVAFNPTSDGLESGTYEYVPLKNIEEKWNEIIDLIKKSTNYYDSEVRKSVSLSNLFICALDYEDSRYYLCSKQGTNSEKLLKGKTVLFAHQDNIEIATPSDVFIMSSYVGFVIDTEEDKVLIFDKKAFQDIFKYDDYQKEKVNREISKIDSWTFLDSTKLIKEKIDQKNVYQNLIKIFDDEEYMKQISSITPIQLKQNLLNSSPENFSESDFKGDNLVVSIQNLEVIMKMLAKGFKFNFFTNNAE